MKHVLGGLAATLCNRLGTPRDHAVGRSAAAGLTPPIFQSDMWFRSSLGRWLAVLPADRMYRDYPTSLNFDVRLYGKKTHGDEDARSGKVGELLPHTAVNGSMQHRHESPTRVKHGYLKLYHIPDCQHFVGNDHSIRMRQLCYT